ncbi:hypothetical protein MHB50_02735 [Siminovitchia sp. FSL H7-0308]|uniref:Transposase n=1 Tax=Siminovitchia thermophila TaxID=1245522 RepID=A0ABS2R2N0_9BACI|nr:hypothetical protein [Siminovitchia thermophila]MBM7713888.1 hypothetical protein [Siminovitchia thermophila]
MRNDILKLEHNGDAQAKVLKVFSLAVKVLTFWKKLFNGADRQTHHRPWIPSL